MASKETTETPASDSTGKIESSPAADTKQQQTILQKREIDTGFGKVIVHIQGNAGLPLSLPLALYLSLSLFLSVPTFRYTCTERREDQRFIALPGTLCPFTLLDLGTTMTSIASRREDSERDGERNICKKKIERQ